MADDNVVIENATIIFRNFVGKQSRFNKEGDRNFAVLLDDDTAHKMEEDDWNVKWLQPREDDDPEATPQAFLPVKLKYDAGRPPRVVMITSRGRTNLGEEEVETLDWVNITNVDLIFRPYSWDVNGKTGIAAYLQSMYVTIEEDYLEKKYADLDAQ